MLKFEIESNEVYIILQPNGHICIEAICINREVLDWFLDYEVCRYNEKLENENIRIRLEQIPSLYPEEYKISLKEIPPVTFNIMYGKMNGNIDLSSHIPSYMWAANCIVPYRHINIFATPEEARDHLRSLDDPDNANFYQQLCYSAEMSTQANGVIFSGHGDDEESEYLEK